MNRGVVAPLTLAGMVVVCAVVAAGTGHPVWAAVLGAGLALAFWGLEYLAWRRAWRVSFNGAIAVALGGMVLRFALVLGALVVVALLDRAAFATVVLSFLAAFTVYTGLRLFLFAGEGGARHEVRLP
jgi:hypothetical protein